jgi:hypothetical protein
MHIKEAVSLQQHLEIGFPDATIVVFETARGGGCRLDLRCTWAKAGLGTARCMHDQGSRALAKSVSAEGECSNMTCVEREIGELCLKYDMYVCNDEEPGTMDRNAV